MNIEWIFTSVYVNTSLIEAIFSRKYYRSNP